MHKDYREAKGRFFNAVEKRLDMYTVPLEIDFKKKVVREDHNPFPEFPFQV